MYVMQDITRPNMLLYIAAKQTIRSLFFVQKNSVTGDILKMIDNVALAVV